MSDQQVDDVNTPAYTPTKGQTQGAFDPSQVAWSAAPNYAGTPTEYYNKSGQLIGYLDNNSNIASTSGLNFVDAKGNPVSAPTDKHSLFQLTDAQGNLLYNNPNYGGGGGEGSGGGETNMYTTQNNGAPALQQLSSMIKMNAPSPGILQDPNFLGFLGSAGAMAGAAALAPALSSAGALGTSGDFLAADAAATQAGQGAFSAAQALGMPLDQAVTSGLIAADGTLTDAGAAALMGGEAGAGAATAGAGLTAADALKYAKLGLTGAGLLQSLTGQSGTGSGGQGGSTGSGGSGTTTAAAQSYSANGPWNNNGNPLSGTNLTWAPHQQKPITAGDENVKTLFSSLDPGLYSQLARSGMVPSGVGGSNYFTYGSPAQTTQPTTAQDPLAYQMPQFAQGGGVLAQLAQGGDTHVPEFITGATGHYVKGRGDGQSDDIPAMLADGEYVFDSSAVSTLGNGSSDAGAKLLDAFRESLREHTRSASKDKIPPKVSPLEYMKAAMKKVGVK